MTTATKTLGLTEDYTFGTLTIANSFGEQSSTQGKFAYRMKDGFMLILKWNAKRQVGVLWASERIAVLWQPGKRNTAGPVDTTLYIGKCSCGYKTPKRRNGNDADSFLEQHLIDSTPSHHGNVEVAN
jgi:hypothetical protein